MTKAVVTGNIEYPLSALSFEGADVRVITIDGEPAFVGKDVCDRLGYVNPTKAMNDHCRGITKRYPLATNGGIQEVRVLSEADVLRLIVRSKRPEAERFERWVFEEVLPAIRKTGGYMAAAPKSRLTGFGTIVLQCLEASFDKSASGFSTVRQARLVSAPVVNLIRQFWLEANLKADGLTFHSL